MNNFTFTDDNCKEKTTSTWLISVLQFSLKANVFKLLESFNFKIKKVRYSTYQKLIVTIMSISIGCETTKDTNEKLGGEKLPLNMFDIDTVSDQSQINEIIRRFDCDSITHLQAIHHNLFIENSNR